MNIQQIKKAAEIAKSRTNDKRWTNAINAAVVGAETWIITELQNCLAITTESGNTYFANGACQCKAYEINKQACKHRALYRLYQIASEIEETAGVAVSTPVPEVYCSCCGAPAPQEWDVCPNCGTEGEWMTEQEFFEEEVATTSRKNLIIEICAAWPATWPPLYSELLARFGKSNLDYLDDDQLRRVRLAIAA